MDDATIIALVILIGVFLVMIVTIMKSGVEAAIKVWGVMGALTGMAFGAITSFYFTKEKMDSLEGQNQANQSINQTLTRELTDAKDTFHSFATALNPNLRPLDANSTSSGNHQEWPALKHNPDNLPKAVFSDLSTADRNDLATYFDNKAKALADVVLLQEAKSTSAIRKIDLQPEAKESLNNRHRISQ